MQALVKSGPTIFRGAQRAMSLAKAAAAFRNRFSGPASQQAARRRKKKSKKYKRKTKKSVNGVRTLGTPKDMYLKETCPNFKNFNWTATANQPNYYINWNFDPLEKTYMDSAILSNPNFLQWAQVYREFKIKGCRVTYYNLTDVNAGTTNYSMNRTEVDLYITQCVAYVTTNVNAGTHPNQEPIFDAYSHKGAKIVNQGFSAFSFYIPLNKWVKDVDNEDIKDVYYETNLTGFPQSPNARIYGSARFNRAYKPTENEILIPMRYTISYDILFRYKKFPSAYNMPAMGS